MYILSLTLYTSHLEEQKSFYQEVFNCKVLKESEKSFEIGIGDSSLIFKEAKETFPYHFAINIPSNKIEDAKVWLSNRVELLQFEGKEIIDFSAWNAEAIYFKDEDQNIVEFISRHNLNRLSDNKFDNNSLLNISEIGVPSIDINTLYQELEKCNLPIYDGSMDRFCAVGDENGLFICINHQKKKEWFPSSTFPHVIDFELLMEHEKEKFKVVYQNGNLNIKKQVELK
ncbi:VOC family protein [Flammeovirga pacifica]|uniref:VOC domain-containing protein n=1 Tax=Flammeovirga pacifica TaxID=915059 RepID=A0A1S1Z4K5_FLAPC|nr:hypothetical protein [Flammeovirga pacifica]OHX68157.1 hypothetical protein NH26_18300 [Flammeovirga pacifica]